MENRKMMIGYIQRYSDDPDGQDVHFKFKKAPYTRHISSRSDKVKCRMFYDSLDYEDVEDNSRILRDNPQLMLVQEPFILDDELEKKATDWVEWANKAGRGAWDPFYGAKGGGNESEEEVGGDTVQGQGTV